MKDTPRTNEWETYCDECYYHLWRVRRKNERGFNDGYHVHNGEEAKALVDLLNKQDSELNEARAEIERLDTAGIHSCHKDCQRPNCVLRRERDELATCLASEKITRNHIVERASETERELNAVTEQRDKEREIYGKSYSAELARSNHYKQQRDRLAEAMTRIKNIYENPEKGCIPSSSDMYDEALQSLTTNKEDQERKSPASDGSI
jgi:hypothetical protein